MRSDRAKYAVNDRMQGTADENKAAVAGTNSAFGTYTVDPADKSITFVIQASLLPNQEGQKQKRMITAATEVSGSRSSRVNEGLASASTNKASAAMRPGPLPARR